MESLTLGEHAKKLRFAHTAEDFYYEEASAGEAISRLRELIRMDEARLLLLTGPNGCGKTMLLRSLLVEEAEALCRCVSEPDAWLLGLLRREWETGQRELPEERLLIFEELWRLAGKTATQREFTRRLEALLRRGGSALLVAERPEPWEEALLRRCDSMGFAVSRTEMRHPGPACRAAFGKDCASRLGVSLTPGEAEALAEAFPTIPALRAGLLRRSAERELRDA